MASLPGGYTNITRRSHSGQIEKRYEGSDRQERVALEHACLARLSGLLPVPTVISRSADPSTLIMAEVGGQHGQVLLDAGYPSLVLRRAGELLRALQPLEPSVIPELPGSGSVIVHGDFGPQNILIDKGRTSALVDWEFAHRGEPLEDLAWAEWIVRMHHPQAVDSLGELHEGADLSFEWPTRHAAMVRRCEDLLRYCQRQRRDGADQWRERLRTTEAWTQ